MVAGIIKKQECVRPDRSQLLCIGPFYVLGTWWVQCFPLFFSGRRHSFKKAICPQQNAVSLLM
jgi:hypothetical protein